AEVAASEGRPDGDGDRVRVRARLGEPGRAELPDRVGPGRGVCERVRPVGRGDGRRLTRVGDVVAGQVEVDARAADAGLAGVPQAVPVDVVEHAAGHGRGDRPVFE